MNLLNKIDKPLFIVNLEANERRSLYKWKQVEYYLDNYNIRYDVKFTKKRKKAVNLVRKDKKHRTIIGIGGDTTANAIVEGAMQNDSEKVLGMVPGGIANLIPKTFDIYSDPDKFHSSLLNGNIKEIDVGMVNGKYFLGWADVGFGSAVLEERNKRRFLKGKLAYYAAGLRAFFKYTSNKIKIKFSKKEIDKTSFLTVISNIKYYADMKISPFAEPDDGLLDLCLIEGESNLELIFNNLPLAYSGKHIHNPEVYCDKAKQFEIKSSKPLLLGIDGDLMGKYNYLKFGIADRKIKMLA